MNRKPLVTILMATFNGATFIEDQLNSIINQDFQSWELIIRDDGSSDETVDIIQRYVKEDARICHLRFGSSHGSACINFSELFDWAYLNDKDYIMFADQDDIWASNKVSTSLKELKRYELLYGKDVPLLCYGTFEFIDRVGRPISQSLKIPSKLKFSGLITENFAWGCTMIINKAALLKIKHIPPHSVNHDHYIALVVACFGHCNLISQVLIKYRQHDKNVSGNVDNMSFINRFRRYILNHEGMVTPLLKNLQLVISFYSIYKDDMPAENRQIVEQFLKAYRTSMLSLVHVMLKSKIFKVGLLQNVAYFYTLMLLRKKVVASDNQGNYEHILR
jgi:glycosyltransferase involved in cell wall biosynthesis